MIGLGYYDTLTPPVLRRNILENPAWYTAYTPYQPEISQGRLEALLNFQTMVADLTGMEVANASMLDEATAAAEAMTLMHRAARASPTRFVVDADVFPQTAAVIETRAEPLGIEIVTADLRDGLPDGDFFGVIVQLPGASGVVVDWSDLIAEAHERGALVAVGADLLALTLITPPGELGADVASAPPSASVCRWASVDRTPATSRCTPSTPVSCPAGWSGCPSTPTVDGVPARAADPRAAHPPRQGDLQHLHRAGAAGDHRRDVRELPRRRRAAAIARRVHGHAVGHRDRPGRGWCRGRARLLLRHRARPRAGSGRRRSATAAKARGINLRLVDADHVSVVLRRGDHRRARREVLSAFGADPRRCITGRARRSSRAHPTSSPIRPSRGTAPRPR